MSLVTSADIGGGNCITSGQLNVPSVVKSASQNDSFISLVHSRIDPLSFAFEIKRHSATATGSTPISSLKKVIV